jgi:hypothetical protein
MAAEKATLRAGILATSPRKPCSARNRVPRHIP